MVSDYIMHVYLEATYTSANKLFSRQIKRDKAHYENMFQIRFLEPREFLDGKKLTTPASPRVAKIFKWGLKEIR